MKRKTGKAYFNEQWKEMTGRLKAFIKNGDQEELHQFRVQVKKLRAMLTLLDSPSAKRKLSRDFKPVRRIFQHCGNVRNAYINLQLGVRYKLQNQEFIDKQLYTIENGTIEIKEQGKEYLKIIKSVHNKLESDLTAISDKEINEFYKAQLEQISGALADLQFNDELHDCRKRIKTLVYNRKIANDALDGKLPINTDYLDKLQSNIGDWHDNILAIGLFSSPEVDDKPVVTKLKQQNTRLKKSIVLLSGDFWKKALPVDEPAVEKQD
jgi:CHAD domain-containing protein